MNYSTINNKKQQIKPKKDIFWLNFRVDGSDTSYFLEQDLPAPTLIQHQKDYYTLHYAIDGFIGTKKLREYVNDTKEKIALLLGATYLEYNPSYTNSFSNFTKYVYTLNMFSNIRDLRIKDTIKRRKEPGLLDKDKIFELARFKCYDLKLHDKLTFEACYEAFYTINTSYELNKSHSDIKAKARSVYKWTDEHYNPVALTNDEIRANRKEYDKKYYENKRKKGNEMTRQEHAKRIHTKLADDTKKKVLNLITGMFKDEYKKKNGNWNITKIAKDSGTSRPTVMKYLPKETLF